MHAEAARARYSKVSLNGTGNSTKQHEKLAEGVEGFSKSSKALRLCSPKGFRFLKPQRREVRQRGSMPTWS